MKEDDHKSSIVTTTATAIGAIALLQQQSGALLSEASNSSDDTTASLYDNSVATASAVKQMIGGCCVCADDSGYCDNPLVYCDGAGCNVAVHQACYGIVTVPEGPWFCKRCELNDKNCYCRLCPSKEGAMKRTDNGGWAHVICALYIPEITFANVRTMEPIVINNVRSERLNKKCHICETYKRENGDDGVCVNCSKGSCKLWFHVTCAQASGLLCEDHSLPGNNVKYCIYCKNHNQKLNSEYIKRVPPFKTVSTSKSKTLKPKAENSSSSSASSSSNNKKSSSKVRTKALLEDDKDGKKPAKKLKTSHESSKTNDSGNQSSTSSVSSSASVNKIIKTESKDPLENQSSHNSSNNNNKTSHSCSSSSKLNDLYDDDSQPTPSQVTPQTEAAPATNDANEDKKSMSNEGVKIESLAISDGSSVEAEQMTRSSTNYSLTSMLSQATPTPSPLPPPLPPPQPNIAESKINLLLKSSDTTSSLTATKFSVVDPTLQVIALPVDKNKELAAHLLADLSIQVENDQQPTQEPQLSDLLLTTNTEMNNNSKAAVVKKPSKKASNISSLLDSPPKSSNKISSIVAASTTTPTMSPKLFSGTVATEEKKTKKPKAKRKSLDEANESSESKTTPTESPSKSNAKRRKQQSNNESLDMFGNRLNSLACLPPGCRNDFEIFNENDKQQSTATASTSLASLHPPKTSTISSILTRTPLLGPPKPALQNKYPILDEENQQTSDSLNQFPETLEDLLLKKWQLDSEFLMEQSQHFDIASLLNCLYQLKKENRDLDSKANELSKKRDQLLLINTRLAVPLEIRATLPNDSSSTGLINSNNNKQQQQMLTTTPKTSLIPTTQTSTTPPTQQINNSNLSSTFNLNNELQSSNNQLYGFANTAKATNGNLNSPSSSNSKAINKNNEQQSPSKTPKIQKLTKKQLQLKQNQQAQGQTQSANDTGAPAATTHHALKINEYLAANVNNSNTKPSFTNEMYSQYNQQQQQQQQQLHPIAVNTNNNAAVNSGVETISPVSTPAPATSNTNIPSILTGTPILLNSLGTSKLLPQNTTALKHNPPSSTSSGTPPQMNNRSTPTPTSHYNDQQQQTIVLPPSLLQHRLSPLLNDPNFKTIANNPHFAAVYYELNKQQLNSNSSEQDYKKMEKLNHLLSLSASGGHLPPMQQNQGFYTGPQTNELLQTLSKSPLSSLMLKQPQHHQQQQQQQHFYQQNNTNNNNNYRLNNDLAVPTQPSSTTQNPSTQQQQQQQPTTTSSLASLITNSPNVPITTMAASSSSSSNNNNNNNNNNQTAMSNNNEFMYHHLHHHHPNLAAHHQQATTSSQNQNILLAPLNYSLQNILSQVDPATAHSILSSLTSGNTLVPSHVDILNLIPHLASQHQQQLQQQYASAASSATTSHTTTSTTTAANDNSTS